MTGASRPSVRVGKRTLAAFAAGSIAVPLSFGLMGGTAFAAAQGSSTPPAPTSIQGVCPAGQTPDSNFPDTQTDFFKDAINCLVAYGVTQGYPDGNYKPSLNVNREQMALFFFRVGKAAGMSWNTSDAGFKDINTASSQEAKDAINALANAKVIQGFTDGTYRPAVVVQRDAMAKFIANTVKVLGGPDLTTSTNDYYTDDAGNIFENFINGITDGKISNGMGGHTYGVGQPVARDAMAGFISRSMEVLFDAGKLPGQFGAVKLNSTSAAQGGTLTGTVQGTAVSVSGCGLTNQALSDTDSSASGTQFSVTIPASQATGNCTLTFTYTDANGKQQTAQRTITVTQGQSQSNQTLSVTPTSTATLPVTVNPDTTTTDDRQYSVSGLTTGTTYTVALVPAANVTTSSNGTVTFADTDSNNAADNIGDTSVAWITVLNGAAEPNATGLATAQPVNGAISFTVDGTATGSVVPVVFVDANANGQLDLTAPTTANANPKTPSESFGVGGKTTYVPQQGTIGLHGPGAVTAVDTSAKYLTMGGATYNWDANDVFQYQGVGITQAQFESMVSVGDTVTINYNPNAAGVSTFNITVDTANAPTAAPTIAVRNLDNGTTANDVVATFTPNPNAASGETYQLLQGTAGAGVDATCGTADDVAPSTFAAVTGTTQGTGSTAGTITLTKNNVANGCYEYKIQSTSPVSGATAQSPTSTPGTPVPAAADTTAPTSTYIADKNGTGLANTVDAGDTIKVVFSEPMAAPGNGDTIRATDGDGTVADIVCGTNATCTINTAAETVNSVSQPAGTVITLAITAAPSPAAAGTTVGLQTPATVTDQSGYTDLAGNAWNIGTSTDKTIDTVASF